MVYYDYYKFINLAFCKFTDIIYLLSYVITT